MTDFMFKQLLTTKNIDEDSNLDMVAIGFSLGKRFLSIYGYADNNFELQIDEFGFFTNDGKWTNEEDTLTDAQKSKLSEILLNTANDISIEKENEKKEEEESLETYYHAYDYSFSTLANRI